MARDLMVFVPTNNRDKHGNPKPLDGTNELVRQARGNAYRANKRKQENESHVAAHVAAAMEAQGWTAPKGMTTVTLTFVEVGYKRDPDNVFGAAKFILDALCKPQHTGHLSRGGREVVIHASGCGAIEDDSQEYVELRCALAERPDRTNPGVWVRLHTEEE